MAATFETPAADRYFEDYVAGSEYEFGSVTVTEDEIIDFARRFDPQYFHIDPRAAKDGPFGGLIASGLHTMALMMRLYADHFLPTVASLGSPGIDEVRWPIPVRPDDTLRLRIEIIETRGSKSDPSRGIVRSHVELVNQDDDTAMTLTVVNFFRTRAAASG
jgi:acyl dehydratase